MSQSLDTIVTVEQVVCGETFLIRYERRYSATALRIVARYVHDKRTLFDWIDGVMLARKIIKDADRYAELRECHGK